MNPVDLSNHYWIVAGSTTQVWSSKALGYVPVDDPTYVTWLGEHPFPPFQVATENQIWAVLEQQAADAVSQPAAVVAATPP